MVLTHAQRDHMGGLKFIARNFDVREFWWNGDGYLGSLGRALAEKKIKARVVDRSAAKFMEGNALVEVLHPGQGSGLDQNNMCLVLRIRYGAQSFLFTGDIGGEAEAELEKRDIGSTVLKAPHHGSRHSSSMGFLKKVRPSVVVVSAGRKNVFGFPHAEALERYNEIGARVYRTDAGGAITVTTDGVVLRAEQYLTQGAR